MISEKKLADLFKGACHIKITILGKSYEFNQGASVTVEVDVKHRRALLAILSGSELPICEAYIRGDVDVHMDQPEDFLQLLNLRDNAKVLSRPRQAIMGFFLSIAVKSLGTSKMNRKWLSTHYTEDADRIIRSFIDGEHRLYSHGVGYDEQGEVSLDQAAGNKLRWIVEQCQLREGSRVLDVGGGWGSFMRYAGKRGIEVHSISVTDDSCQHLNEVKAENGLDQCTVTKINFWDVPENEDYDAIVCLGTIEHLPYYDRLVTKANRLLRDGGFLHVDGFSVKELNFERDPFIYKYIYPGDNTAFFIDKYLRALENSEFLVCEVENDDYDYYRTILGWSQRFEDNVEALKAEGLSEAMIRVFRIYLWGITNSFRKRRIHAYRAVARKPSMAAVYPVVPARKSESLIDEAWDSIHVT